MWERFGGVKKDSIGKHSFLEIIPWRLKIDLIWFIYLVKQERRWVASLLLHSKLRKKTMLEKVVHRNSSFSRLVKILKQGNKKKYKRKRGLLFILPKLSKKMMELKKSEEYLQQK